MDDLLAQNLMNEMVYAVNYESLATNIVNFFAGLFEAELCTLWRRTKIGDEDKLVLSAAKGSRLLPGAKRQTYTLKDPGEHGTVAGVTAWIAIKREVCLANSFYELTADETKPWIKAHRGLWDPQQFPGWDPKDRSLEAPNKFRNLLGLPIVYRSPKGIEQEDVIGVLKIESVPFGFSRNDKQLAESLMPFVAIALRTMVERENHEQSRQQALRNLTAALLREDPNTFNQVLVQRTAVMLNAKICSLWLYDRSEKKLKLGANYGVLTKENIPEYHINWNAENDQDIEGLTPWVLIRKRTFYGEQHQDLKDHPAWKGRWDNEQWAKMNFGCLYAVPLIDVNGDAFGVLKIENDFNQPKFDAVDRATFDLMADFIALALEFNSRLRADIVYDFFHLLKQPATNAIGALADLRRELKGKRREERISSRLDMLARNLATLRVWILNVYGLATAQNETPENPQVQVSIRAILAEASKNMQNLFDDFDCNLDQVQDVSIRLTHLKRQKVDAILFNILDNSYKYTAETGKDIRAIARCEEGKLILILQDNGRGI
ncbi:MAG: GAF domain-containing protein, partial [Syntrophothermus sp.]